MLARSYLFVPGNRPERFAKACQSAADAVILDLEDAVAPGAKEVARQAVAAWLSSGGRTYVRINAEGSEWFEQDLDALREHVGLLGVVVSKAESPQSLARIAAALPSGAVLLPLIETALGMGNVQQLARCARVERLLFGTLDFQVDTGIRGDGLELLYFRSQLTLASRIAGIGAPVDGVTTSIDDGELIQAETLRARNLGFRGKLCIHPRQIDPIHAAFAFSAQEHAWALRVLEATENSAGAATSVDGKMVDLPVLLKAREIVAGFKHPQS